MKTPEAKPRFVCLSELSGSGALLVKLRRVRASGPISQLLQAATSDNIEV